MPTHNLSLYFLESEYQETDIVENVELNKKEIGKDLLNNSACDQFQPAKTSEMCQNNSTDIKPSISNSSELLDTVAEVENFLTVHHTSSLSSVNAENHLVGTEEDTNLFSSSIKCVALFNDNTSITKYKQCQIALCDYKTGSDNHSEISSSQSKEVEPTNNIVKTKKSVLDLNNENVDIQESGMIDEGNIRPMRKTRSSTTKIRKTLPKIQVTLVIHLVYTEMHFLDFILPSMPANSHQKYLYPRLDTLHSVYRKLCV